MQIALSNATTTRPANIDLTGSGFTPLQGLRVRVTREGTAKGSSTYMRPRATSAGTFSIGVLSLTNTSTLGRYLIEVLNDTASQVLVSTWLTVIATPPSAPLPKANFSVFPTSGTVPLTVQFTNTSTDATLNNWTFGDGTTSTTVSPAHTYTAAGTYTVILDVSNTVGTSSKTGSISVTIPIPPPPITNWATAIANAAPGAILDFTGTSYTGSLTISKALTLKGGLLTIPAGAKGIQINAANVLIDGMEMNGNGTAYAGIWASNADKVSAQNCNIHDIDYAAIMGLSLMNALFTKNKVTNVGLNRNSNFKPGDDTGNLNCYGIAVTNNSGSPVSSNCTISFNTVDNIPCWEGIETHGGAGIKFLDNTITRCNRPIRLTNSGGVRPQNCEISRNAISQPTKRPDVINNYPYNETAVTVYGCDHTRGVDNHVDGFPTGNAISSEGGSTDTIITGTVVTNPV